MRGIPLAAAALVTLAFVLAGCTTKIETQQTEPFRIQLEGASRTIELDEEGEQQTVEIDTCTEATTTCDSTTQRQVEVNVQVTQKSTEPCKVLVTVKDKSSGEELERRIVDVGASGSGSGNGTSGNGTGGSASGQVVVQNIVVNVKGKDNLVVITEAQQGTAQVNIAARDASGNTQGGGGSTGSSTATVTATSTATSTTTTTSSSTNTTTGP